MKDIIIVGAGHLGIDVHTLINAINAVKMTWKIKGFLNDYCVDLKKYHIQEKVIGTIKEWVPTEDEHFVVAIGSPSGRKMVVNILKEKGARFETLISPHSFVHETVEIGEGCLIFSTSKLAPCVKIGNFVTIGDSTLGQNVTIGDYSNTASYVNIYQDISVGERVQIWSHAIVLNNIEDDAVVGAGSVVLNKVKKGMHVFGSPAKRIDF